MASCIFQNASLPAADAALVAAQGGRLLRIRDVPPDEADFAPGVQDLDQRVARAAVRLSLLNRPVILEHPRLPPDPSISP